DISYVPESILVIPLLANICPIAWITDSVIYCDQVDKKFLESLTVVRDSFRKMYPKHRWEGELITDSLVNNQKYFGTNQSRSALFFSGGVDSLASYIQTRFEKPSLIAVWGADISVDNIEGWQP